MKIFRISSSSPVWSVFYILVCKLPYVLISQGLQVLERRSFQEEYILIKDEDLQNFKFATCLVCKFSHMFISKYLEVLDIWNFHQRCIYWSNLYFTKRSVNYQHEKYWTARWLTWNYGNRHFLPRYITGENFEPAAIVNPEIWSYG